jgi:Fic family protein
MLCHLQEVLTNDTLDKPDAAGRFRRDDEKIIVQDSRTGEPVYFPPAASTIPDRVNEICKFANAKSVPFIHPILKAIVLHFAIGYLHPFVDGNGRTARAVFYWYMLKSGYRLFEFLPISRIIKNHPIKYSRAFLYSETDGGDVTYFAHYHLQVVIRALDELHTYLVEQQVLLREAKSLLEDRPEFNLRQRLLIEDALRHPNQTYTVRAHEGEYRITYNTARSDLLGLAEVGFLVGTKRPHSKEVVYHPPRDLKKRIRDLPKSQKRKTAPAPAKKRRKPNDRPGLFD